MNIGDIVYYYEHWSDSIVKAKIEKLDQKGIAKIKDICTVDYLGEEMEHVVGSCNRIISELYCSPQSAHDAYCLKQQKKIRKYCSEIKNLENLLRFPVTHCLYGEEYTDQEACEAYKIRTKELTGIEL